MKTDKWNRPLVPCEICGTDTPMTGTKRCDGCWELETRIKHDPELALKIIVREGLLEPTDAMLWALASTLHSNVPEEKRPKGWMDFSDEQLERLKKAAKAMLAAAVQSRNGPAVESPGLNLTQTP